MKRDKALKAARELPLGDLAKKVLRGSCTDGVDDEVLIERCRALDKMKVQFLKQIEIYQRAIFAIDDACGYIDAYMEVPKIIRIAGEELEVLNNE